MRVSDLEAYLLEQFPLADAEPWDHVGLSVGAPNDAVSGVFVALDAGVSQIEATAQAGANVLVTHHPVYLKAPTAFVPPSPQAPSSSAAVFRAIERGVSIISLHTNLDRSLQAREILPKRVGLTALSSLEHWDDPAAHGLGSICDGWDATLRDLAQKCAQAFGGAPRVWGDPLSCPSRIAFVGGAGSDAGEQALKGGAQVLVTGEAGYHVCQDLYLRGLSLILLGHDRSEEPFVEILRDAVVDAGIPADLIGTIVSPQQWWTA